jgi:hypothetical protein
MYSPIETYQKASTRVLKTQSLLFASAVCDTLEKAGIAARLHVNGNCSVEVPNESLGDAYQLLFTQPRSGEIFCFKG